MSIDSPPIDEAALPIIEKRRVVPAWAEAMNGHQGWTTKASQLPNGELLTVTATDPKEIPHIRGSALSACCRAARIFRCTT